MLERKQLGGCQVRGQRNAGGRCWLSECGWPGALGTANVGAGSWRMTRSQTLKTEFGGFQDTIRGEEGSGVGKSLAHGRATKSLRLKTSERGGTGKTRSLLGVQDGLGRVGEKQGDHRREGEKAWPGRGLVVSDGKIRRLCWGFADALALGCGTEEPSFPPTLPM